jgi:hypothetical protein
MACSTRQINVGVVYRPAHKIPREACFDSNMRACRCCSLVWRLRAPGEGAFHVAAVWFIDLLTSSQRRRTLCWPTANAWTPKDGALRPHTLDNFDLSHIKIVLLSHILWPEGGKDVCLLIWSREGGAGRGNRQGNNLSFGSVENRQEGRICIKPYVCKSLTSVISIRSALFHNWILIDHFSIISYVDLSILGGLYIWIVWMTLSFSLQEKDDSIIFHAREASHSCMDVIG